MDASIFKPFIASIQNVFATMLQLPVTVHTPKLKDNVAQPTYDVSGVIGLSGEVVGSVVLSFPKDSAERIVALFCGQPAPCGSPDFADAVGELVNMVSGGAKAMFNKKVSISCPTVVVGPGHTLSRPSEIPCVMIPCSTDCGDLVLEIALQDRTGQTTGPAPATAAAN
jgi:chemotaxis protein CheX